MPFLLPILVKVHFDVIMTMIADTLYTMLAQKLRGFESCDAAKIHRLFVKGKANVTLKGNKITVIYPRKAHNPILRSVPWHNLASNPFVARWCQFGSSGSPDMQGITIIKSVG